MGKAFERNYAGKGMEIEVDVEEERGWFETKLMFPSARRRIIIPFVIYDDSCAAP